MKTWDRFGWYERSQNRLMDVEATWVRWKRGSGDESSLEKGLREKPWRVKNIYIKKIFALNKIYLALIFFLNFNAKNYLRLRETKKIIKLKI